MTHARDVVITGLGVVCPLGVGADAYWQGLLAGQSGVERLPELPETDLPFRYVSRVKDFDAKQFVQPRKTIKVMCQAIQSAYAASVMAMQHSGLAKESVSPDRFGVVLGSEMLYGELDEVLSVYRHGSPLTAEPLEHWSEAAFKELYPLWMLKYLPNMAACHISIAQDARGPNNSIVSGGASSLLAVMEAASAIRRGHADAMLAGGSGAISGFSCLAFRGWEHLSKWRGPPAQASRPFDRQRSGIVPGEGAGMLLLESRELAERRGAAILGRLAGWASAFEPPGGHSLHRTGRAIVQVIERSLAASGLAPGEIGHVNAHGEGSIHQDRAEAQAIHQTLGDVPVTALKSYFGDLGAGSGAVELIGTVLALGQGRVPPTLNFDEPDPECPVNVVQKSPLMTTNPTALALNQSYTGQSAAVVVARE